MSMLFRDRLRAPSATSPVIATSHAGEILQGAIRRHDRTRRLLLSLPAPALWTRADIIPTPGHSLALHPHWARKAYDGAHELLTRMRLAAPEVLVRLSTNIPVGKGCGSSTADILATTRALLGYIGVHMCDESVARLIVEVERASDSSVLSKPAIFRHREGVVEEYLAGGFPRMRVLVLDAQPTHTVETVSLPRARYSHAQLTTFEGLIRELRTAFRERNPSRLGAVATASARISQQFLPKPHLEALVDLVERWGGYGVAVAHSGTVASALLPAALSPCAMSALRASTAALGMAPLTHYVLGA